MICPSQCLWSGRMAPILSGQVEGRRRPKMAILGSAQLPAETRIPSAVSTAPVTTLAPRHSALVRVTHWITTICFFALLLTGIEIVISHPRFYWGETGTVLPKPLFQLAIPSSRRLVPTGYGYALPWSVTLWGVRQSSRTSRFFVSLALVLFLFVHVLMVCLAGFWSRTGAMITGRTGTRKEHA